MKIDNLAGRIPSVGGDIAKRTVKDQISDKLAYMISSGLIRVGDELPSERELAATLNVSRETVRGAIQALAARGLVEISQGSRTRVVQGEDYRLGNVLDGLGELSKFSVAEVYATRLVIDRAVVRDAAIHISDASLERLKALLDEQATLFSDPVRFQISDREFHTEIYDACSNKLLAHYASNLYAYGLDVRRKVMKEPGAVERSYQDHCKIHAALMTRNPDAAEQAFCSHTDNVRDTSITAM